MHIHFYILQRLKEQNFYPLKPRVPHKNDSNFISLFPPLLKEPQSFPKSSAPFRLANANLGGDASCSQAATAEALSSQYLKSIAAAYLRRPKKGKGRNLRRKTERVHLQIPASAAPVFPHLAIIINRSLKCTLNI
jgi:hypothetical protein